MAVGNGEDGPHALQVLGRQHDRPLLGAGRQGGGGQGGAHRHHLVPVVTTLQVAAATAAEIPSTAAASVAGRVVLVVGCGGGDQLGAGRGLQHAQRVVGR